MKNDLVNAILEILDVDWDPLGTGDNPILSDEYDGVMNKVMELIGRRGSVTEIATVLEEYEHELRSPGDR